MKEPSALGSVVRIQYGFSTAALIWVKVNTGWKGGVDGSLITWNEICQHGSPELMVSVSETKTSRRLRIENTIVDLICQFWEDENIDLAIARGDITLEEITFIFTEEISREEGRAT